MSSTPTRQQRRAADRRGEPPNERERLLRLAFSTILLAALAGGGWWVWRGATSRGAIRDGSPSWAPDSKRLIFYSELGGKADLVVADLDGGNRVNVSTTPSDEGGPAYSPDGKSIAFDSDRDGNFEIYVMRAGGEAARRLTNDPARDVAPAWSPDGRHIVFMSTRDNPEFDIYRMDADGGNIERLTTGSSNWFPQYSPDGGQIAMHVMRDVHVLNLKSRTMRRLTHEPMNGMYPSWSGDGRQIAFMSWRNGRTEIFVMRADGADQRRLVTMPTGDAVDPRWSPDGEYIAFVHVPSGGLTADQQRTQQRLVYLVHVKTGKLTRISR